jgi:hypothetical protein
LAIEYALQRQNKNKSNKKVILPYEIGKAFAIGQDVIELFLHTAVIVATTTRVVTVIVVHHAHRFGNGVKGGFPRRGGNETTIVLKVQDYRGYMYCTRARASQEMRVRQNA